MSGSSSAQDGAHPDRGGRRPRVWTVSQARRAGLAAHGPLTARQARDLGLGEDPDGGHWGWNWSESKRVLEHLFADGTLASVGRTPSFERRYLRAERLWPADGAAGSAGERPEPSDPDLAHALPLVEQSLRAVGIATPASVADYYRLPVALTRRALDALAADGTAEAGRIASGPAAGQGTTTAPAYRHRLASVPRAATGTAPLSPFDPMVFHRPRVEHLFGVRYRLGIYTPAERRTRGYYSLLLLEGERLTAQVDLKADRSGEGALLVHGAWTEPPGDHPDPATPPPEEGQTEAALADRLETMRAWLGLGAVVVPSAAPGDLARRLRGD